MYDAKEWRTLNGEDFAEYVELGEQNARIIELATNHCLLMRFVQFGGQGILEVETGLPLNTRRIECDVALGTVAGIRLDEVALNFYAEHCRGCQLRQPTRRLPNLESEFLAREEASSTAEAAERLRRWRLGITWAERVERRRSLRVTADPAAASILDDLDILDANPEWERNTDQERKARQRLTALAGRAHDRFSPSIIEEIFEAVESVGIVKLLEPLRHLTVKRPEIAGRLISIAVEVLKRSPSLEAGRCLTDHPAHLSVDIVDKALVQTAAVLAGSKTTEDRYLSGPSPVISANDPGPIRVLADLAPDLVSSALAEMLPRPKVDGLILAPSYRRPQASDFDRRAAAGALEYLASTHLELAVGLLPALAISLGVPPADTYDTGTAGSAERALGHILIEDPTRVAPLFENAGQHASEDTRMGLVSAARRAVDMIDPDYAHRRPQDPVLDEEATGEVVDAAFAFFIARTDDSWGADVTFEAAEAIERMGRRLSDRPGNHIDATLGAFVTLTRHRLEPPPQRLATTAPPDPLASAKAFTRMHTLYQASMRLLRAVEEACTESDPIAVSKTIAAIITNERDNDLGVDVVMPLLETLGNIGSRLGSQSGVLQAILPTLRTFLVDAEPGPRACALRAWTRIGSRHPVPSTLADLLPALIADTYLVVIDAVVDAANHLTWAKSEDRVQLAAYASRLAANLELPERLDLVLSTLRTLRRHAPNLESLARIEMQALARIPSLEWHQAIKVVEQPWQPDARVTPELAKHWLTLASHRTLGLRHGDAAEEVLNGLLDCGVGLRDLPAADIIDTGICHSPQSPFGALEYAEVLTRAELRDEAVELLQGALDRIPTNKAYAARRSLTRLALAVAQLHASVTPRDPSETVDNNLVVMKLDALAAAVEFSQSFTGEVGEWLQGFQRAAATRGRIVCSLFNLAQPAAIAEALASPTADAPTSDPADTLTNRARDLRDCATTLREGSRSAGSATHKGLAVTGQFLDCVAHLLDAEAADLNADLAQGQAHRTAAQRRAAAINLDAYRSDDPLLLRARALQVTLADPGSAHYLGEVMAQAAALPAPLLFIRSVVRGRGMDRPWRPPADPEPDSPNVAVSLISIDGKLLTGPAIVDPALTHTLGINVQTDPWPSWAERLDAELVSTLTDTELQRPVLSWQQHQYSGDPQTFEGTGSLHVRYSVPTTQQAPPVLVRLTWRGTDERGIARSEELDVAGHREFRVRPYDPARDATTQYEVFDEHLLTIYENLAAAGYRHNQLQAFARLLNAISRAGLAMTWNKKYRRGRYVSERDFHTDLHRDLLADPTLDGRVERGTTLALGLFDTRHDGITAELKVARDQPVTPETATKYIGQPTQYAAADGARLSILVILDMSPKVLPIGTPENYLFVLNPQQHGMTEPHAPSVVVTLVINGNLPVPSSWSRRKTPTRET